MSRKSRAQTHVRLSRVGLSETQINALLRCGQYLETWGTRESNGEVERDEKTNRCYLMSDGKRIGRTPDRETGSLKRAKSIAGSAGLAVYYQTDPRGCALYIYDPKELKGRAIDTCYSSIGLAVEPI